MVKLLDEEVRSREILTWKGLHLFHAQLSSCSQKTRLFLAEKGVAWRSCPVDLVRNENLSEFFLGINPRGLVPVLVDNGEVHIESNDILRHIEARFPGPALIPRQRVGDIDELLSAEDALHVDIRNITFRFIYAPPVAPKSAEDLDRYRRHGAPTVGGAPDDQKQHEIEYWTKYAEQRVTDEAARTSITRFRCAFDGLEARLGRTPFLAGDALSVADIAWFVYAGRLSLAGYPLEKLHPLLNAWRARLSARQGWAREVAIPEPFQRVIDERRRDLERAHATLAEIGALAGDGARL